MIINTINIILKIKLIKGYSHTIISTCSNDQSFEGFKYVSHVCRVETEQGNENNML